MTNPSTARTLPPRPPLVTAAVWSYVVVALANVGVGARTLAFVPALAASYERQGQAAPQGAIVFAVLVIVVATLLFSGALVFFALRLRSGSTWARPVLLTISTLSLAALLGGGGPGVVVIVLCGIAAIVVTRSPVSAWLRAAQGLRPA